MKKKQPNRRPIAQELSTSDIDKLLAKNGRGIHSKRKARTTLESFAYKINVSRSAMTGYEAGGDMYLSTFLKLLHGLEVSGEDFFKELK